MLALFFYWPRYSLRTRWMRGVRATLFRKFPTPCQRNTKLLPNFIAIYMLFYFGL